MPSPCNNVSVSPIKVSQLVRYSNLDGGDLLLTVESGSSLLSRRSTINDLKNSLGRLTGSYSGSFTGSFIGVASGSFSGSYWGKVISKNTVASGSFSGSYWGKVVSKNTVASGSFSGSHWGSLVSKNTKATGSFRGSIVSTNTIASGSFSGSYWGSIASKNTKATGSFNGNVRGNLSGSFSGSVLSKNTKATGSFNGNVRGNLSGSFSGSMYSKFAKLSGSFSGSFSGTVKGKNSLITGSFRGVDNITNFKNTGKKVSFNGTASYAVSSSYALTSSYLSRGSILSVYSVQYSNKQFGVGTSWFDTGLSITITPKSPTSKFLINASIVLGNGNSSGNTVAGLYKDSTSLIDQFASVNLTTFDASPQSATYIDTATDLSSRTYVVKVKGTDAGTTWYTNRSEYSAVLFYGTSSMTILELNM